jgi:hypothetical protein
VTRDLLPPAAQWNEHEQCWEIIFNEEITIRFSENHVYVIGSLVNMRVFYDQITEERGIEFRAERISAADELEDVLALECPCGGNFIIYHAMLVCGKCDQLARDVFKTTRRTRG